MAQLDFGLLNDSGIPNAVGGMLGAYRSGMADTAAQQQNLLRKQVGGMLSSEGPLAAANVAFSGGDIQTGIDLQNMPIERQAKLYDFLGRAATAADTPEKWSQLIGTLGRTFGPDAVKGFEDFSQRQAAIDISMTAQEKLAERKLSQGPELPASFREYQLAQEDPAFGNYLRNKNAPQAPAGYSRNDDGTMAFIPGGPADPEVMRRQPSRMNTPPGYRWKNPENPEEGLVAIPGGPGEKVDAEVAGRLGLAKSFLEQAPEIKKAIKSGELGITAYFGAGRAGEIRRQMDSGAEALLRMLTGAGMNNTEAEEYVRRYRYSPTDMPETSISKIEQLERELRSVAEVVGRGRGGTGDILPPVSGGSDAPTKTSTGVGYKVLP